MKRQRRKIWFVIALGIPLVMGSVLAQEPVDFTRPGELSDPLDDPVNNDVKTNSVFALFMRLEITGDVTTAHDLRMTRIPVAQADFSEDPAKIVLIANDSSGALAGRTSVSDRKMIARNGQTIVLNSRSVSVVVPLLARPQLIEISHPDSQDVVEVNVETVVGDFCDTFANDPFCAGEPADSSPHYDLLRPPDP